MFYVVTLTKDAWDRFVIQRTCVTIIDDFDFGDHPWVIHHPFKQTLLKTYLHIGTDQYEAEGIYSYMLMKHRDHPYNMTKLRLDLPTVAPVVKKPRVMSEAQIERFLRECNQRGRVRSAETRAKIAAAKKGKPRPPEVLEKWLSTRAGRAPFKGKKHSPESMQQMIHTRMQRKWQLSSS